MKSILNTGNSTVDALGQMNISGNVTPPNWYKTILRDNGKPYLLAIGIVQKRLEMSRQAMLLSIESDLRQISFRRIISSWPILSESLNELLKLPWIDSKKSV